MASLCRSTVVHGTEGLEDLKEKNITAAFYSKNARQF